MARDTDRKIISEALRLSAGRNWPKNQWTARWGDRYELTLEDLHGNELNLTYSENGLLTKLVHWVPMKDNPRYASRTPIPTGKREYVIDVIGGNHSAHLRWQLTQNKNREERQARRAAARS